MTSGPLRRLRNIDADDLAWIDKVLRITAVVVGVCALPLIFFVSIMASDSGTPEAVRSAKHLWGTLSAIDIIGIVCAFLPRPDPPVSHWRLFGFLLLRLPTYATATVGVGGFLWMLVTSLAR
jgi:hypothetical protein